MALTAMKFDANPRGAHVEVRVFAGPDGGHYALTGSLTMRREEWEFFRRCLVAVHHPEVLGSWSPVPNDVVQLLTVEGL